MKILIWLGCLLVATIFNLLLGSLTGFKVGYGVFYLLVCFVAKKLCDKWVEHKNTNDDIKKNNAYINQNVEPIVNATNEILFCRKCGDKLLKNSRFCRKCGTEIFDNNDIVNN